MFYLTLTLVSFSTNVPMVGLGERNQVNFILHYNRTSELLIALAMCGFFFSPKIKRRTKRYIFQSLFFFSLIQT